MSKTIVGIGELLWDVLPNGKKVGGAPANFAFHISQLGLEGCVVSAIGEDTFGDEIVEYLEKKDLNYIVNEVSYPTGTVQVELDDDGIPTYDIKQNVAWDNIAYTSDLEELAADTIAVCFGSLAQRSQVSRDTIHKFIRQIPDDEGQLKIFDINLRQNFYNQDIIEESMRLCNILKINDEELAIVGKMLNFNGLSFENKCWLLLAKYNIKILILTCGSNGSYVFTPGKFSFLPTPKVEVIDTVGAGDSFTASFIAALIEGKSLEFSHQFAVDVAAYVCIRSGATPTLPESIISRLNENLSLSK